MFEHLHNDMEKFRNKTINTNKKLAEITEYSINNKDFHLYSDNYKNKVMMDFLKAQGDLNNLYRGKY